MSAGERGRGERGRGERGREREREGERRERKREREKREIKGKGEGLMDKIHNGSRTMTDSCFNFTSDFSNSTSFLGSDNTRHLWDHTLSRKQPIKSHTGKEGLQSIKKIHQLVLH